MFTEVQSTKDKKTANLVKLDVSLPEPSDYNHPITNISIFLTFSTPFYPLYPSLLPFLPSLPPSLLYTVC